MTPFEIKGVRRGQRLLGHVDAGCCWSGRGLRSHIQVRPLPMMRRTLRGAKCHWAIARRSRRGSGASLATTLLLIGSPSVASLSGGRFVVSFVAFASAICGWAVGWRSGARASFSLKGLLRGVRLRLVKMIVFDFRGAILLGSWLSGVHRDGRRNHSATILRLLDSFQVEERGGEQATFLQTGSKAGSLNPGCSLLTQFRPNRTSLSSSVVDQNLDRREGTMGEEPPHSAQVIFSLKEGPWDHLFDS